MSREPGDPDQPYDREAAILALRARRAAVHGVDPHGYPPLVTPACDRPTRPLPAARRRLYEEHLRGLLGALAAGERPPGPGIPPEVAAPPGVDQVLQAGCRACRGRCCETGGAHAYQTVDSLRRVRETHPELSPEALVALYLAHLPARSVRGSCVFHGARGCTLPRDLRGDMCNRFFCAPLLVWRERALATGDCAAFVVGDDDGLLRAGFLLGVPPVSLPGPLSDVRPGPQPGASSGPPSAAPAGARRGGPRVKKARRGRPGRSRTS